MPSQSDIHAFSSQLSLGGGLDVDFPPDIRAKPRHPGTFLRHVLGGQWGKGLTLILTLFTVAPLVTLGGGGSGGPVALLLVNAVLDEPKSISFDAISWIQVADDSGNSRVKFRLPFWSSPIAVEEIMGVRVDNPPFSVYLVWWWFTSGLDWSEGDARKTLLNQALV